MSPSGDARPLGGRQQVVLATLLVRANQVVSIDQLVGAIWNNTPPSTSRAQVQFCVHALRSEFKALELPANIVTQRPGYKLDVAARRIDANLFESQIEQARRLARHDDLKGAVTAFRSALALWRGPVLEGAVPWVRDQLVWLNELRTTALEECIGHELELGRHRDVVGELRTLVVEHPLSEEFRYLLMLALYRSGRQCEALDAYRDGRTVLINELGLDPGTKLKELEVAILADNGSLVQAPPPAAPDSRCDGWTSPRQLPSAIHDFTGRAALVATIEQSLLRDGNGATASAVPVVSLVGKAGVGKSALAVQVAHQVAARSFPDGQLYVNLKSTTGQAITAHEALGRFLRALGVGGDSIPETEDERAEMYRGFLADRRVLVVLEDASSELQVSALVPGTATCAVLLTGRTRLAGLAGAAVIPVDVLEPREALMLLEASVGTARLNNELREARALVRIAGCLPLALRIIGARLAARPHWSLSSMVTRLADESQRLDELVHGDMHVRGTLALAYSGLDASTATLVRRLGALNTDEFPAWMATVALDNDPRAPDQLDRLVDTQLLDAVDNGSPTAPRFRFHDLIRIFARERLREIEPDSELEVLRRALGAWLFSAEHAHRRLYGGDFAILHGTADRWPLPAAQMRTVVEDPLRWLELERANICAAIAHGVDAGLDELSWDLAVTAVSLFEVRSYFDDWMDTHQQVLHLTRSKGNHRGTGAVLCSLGSLHLNQNHLDLAREVLIPAFDIFRELNDTHGLALTLRNLGLLDRQTGQPAEAVRRYHEALANFARVGDVVGQAGVLSQIAQIELDDGRAARALELLQKAALICGEVRSVRMESQIRYKICKVLIAQGDYETAATLIAEVLDLVREANDRQGQSYAVHLAGVVDMHRGRLDAAAEQLGTAIVICERNNDRVNAARARLTLSRVELMRTHASPALELAQQANLTFLEYKMPHWSELAVNQMELVRRDGGAK
ncbi:AfsR/SARP family transcriptional regulator [Lentzea tibetensis]|uniref:AfsR/SARP family transcriptional regulator n=1 Tax=Lentzea tibetensis TaxID=2591470 RepID=UPI0016490232|nr:BTAD domain-containing putative transcriptional regulator [Lentzea tibetensis]